MNDPRYGAPPNSPTDLERLAVAAEKFAEAADKAVELMGGVVSQLDEIRREVAKMNEPLTIPGLAKASRKEKP